jgi:hypothetical protein
MASPPFARFGPGGRYRLTAALLAVLVLAQTLPRLFGPSWHTIGIPLSLREVEGHTFTWEYSFHENVVSATLTDERQPIVLTSFNTDNYRTLLTTYVAALLAYWTGSLYWAFNAIDAVGWWIGCLAVAGLARRLGATSGESLIAGVLLAAAPIGVYQVGAGTLHVASSVSLAPAFLAALVAMEHERWSLPARTAALAVVLYVASLVYNYQWLIVPGLVLVALTGARPPRQLGILSVGVGAFLLLTAATHSYLGIGGLIARPLGNDPAGTLLGRLSDGDLLQPAFWTSALRTSGRLVATAYHPLVVALALVGAVLGRVRLRALTLFALGYGLLSAVLVPITWVAAAGHAFVYVAAAVGMLQGAGAATRAVAAVPTARALAGSLLADERAPWLVAGALLTLAVLSTNGDLWGDYRYVVSWWDYRYEPR